MVVGAGAGYHYGMGMGMPVMPMMAMPMMMAPMMPMMSMGYGAYGGVCSRWKLPLFIFWPGVLWTFAAGVYARQASTETCSRTDVRSGVLGAPFRYVVGIVFEPFSPLP
jgi:hypothetical protein